MKNHRKSNGDIILVMTTRVILTLLVFVGFLLYVNREWMMGSFFR